MSPKKQSETNKNGRKSITDFLFSKHDPDREYFSDLKQQWSKMDTRKRIYFLVGGLAGLILILGIFFLFTFLLYQWGR